MTKYGAAKCGLILISIIQYVSASLETYETQTTEHGNHEMTMLGPSLGRGGRGEGGGSIDMGAWAESLPILIGTYFDREI